MSHGYSSRLIEMKTLTWANGVYFISVKDNDDIVDRGKIVIAH
jgi:hypothetical protein